MKILIAEDDATSRLLLQTTLKQWGHEVVTTTDGQQAYDILLAKDAPRLAIFDWMMPQLDGIEVCRKAREEAQLEHLYVIILTTRDARNCLHAHRRLLRHNLARCLRMYSMYIWVRCIPAI